MPDNKRPKLCEVPLAEALPPPRGKVVMTMSVGQWDSILAGAYDHGWLLLELDANEVPVRAYQRA